MEELNILMDEIKERIEHLKNSYTIDDDSKAVLIKENKRFLVRCQQLSLFKNLPEGLPMYVKLGDVEMRYDDRNDEYFRDAGVWGVGYKRTDDGKLITNNNAPPHLRNKELIEITYEEWKRGNEGYV